MSVLGDYDNFLFLKKSVKKKPFMIVTIQKSNIFRYLL